MKVEIKSGTNVGRTWDYNDILHIRYYWEDEEGHEDLIEYGKIVVNLDIDGDVNKDSDIMVCMLEEYIGSDVKIVGILSNDIIYDVYTDGKNYYGLYCNGDAVEIVKLDPYGLNWEGLNWENYEEEWEEYLNELGVEPNDYHKWLNKKGSVEDK